MKGKSFENILENRLEDNRWISFVHLLLHFAGIKIIGSFFKLNCYNFYMVDASQKEGLPYLFLKKNHLIIYIIVSLHRRKSFDGHIILVVVVMLVEKIRAMKKIPLMGRI